jgi:hypothetical protein
LGLVFLFGGLKKSFREEARIRSVKVKWKRVEDVRMAVYRRKSIPMMIVVSEV